MAAPEVGNQIINHSNVPKDLFGGFMAQQQRSEQLNQQKLQAEATRKRQRNMDLNNVIDAVGYDTWSPFAETQQKGVEEYRKSVIERVKAGEDPLEVANSEDMIMKRGKLQYMAKHSKAAETAYKTNLETIDSSEILDKESAKAYVHSLANDQSIEDLTPAQMAEALSTPAFYNRGKLVEGVVTNIKESMKGTTDNIVTKNGKVIKMTGTSNNRFPVDANGQITPDFVQHVIDTEPKLAQSIRYGLAREAYEQQSGKPFDPASYADVQAVNKLYETKFDNDDSAIIKQRILDETRGMLNQHQRVEEKDEISSLGDDPYTKNALMMKRQAANRAASGKSAKEDDKAKLRLSTLQGIANGDSAQMVKLKGKDYMGGTVNSVKVVESAPEVSASLAADGSPQFGRKETGKKFIEITVDKGVDDADEPITQTYRLPINSEKEKDRVVNELNSNLDNGKGDGMVTDEALEKAKGSDTTPKSRLRGLSLDDL